MESAYLVKEGLTNQDSESLANISMGKRSDFLPYCGSEKCGKYKSSTVYYYKMVLKENIVGEPTDCPDCGYVLVWKKKKSFLD